MRIRAERDDLADIFSRANRAVGSRPALPILSGVRCDVTGNQLQVTGTDLEMTVRTRTEVEVIEEGSAVIPAKLATEAIRKMPVGAVTLGTSEGGVEISGRGPKFDLRQLPVDDFPQLPEVDFAGSVEVAGDILTSAVAQVVVAASGDAARQILTGVLFEEGDDGVRLVATDSYRLALRDLPGLSLGGSGLVPARGVREMGRVVGSEKIQLAMQSREVQFGSDRGSMTLRLIEGAFPKYRSLLPESYPNRIILEKEFLLDALGRASLVAEEHIPVRLTLMDGGVQLKVTRQDVGAEAEHIPGEYSGEDKEVEVAFNPRYLTDGVTAAAGEKILIDVVDGLKPSVIRGVGDDDFLYLLMPVRV